MHALNSTYVHACVRVCILDAGGRDYLVFSGTRESNFDDSPGSSEKERLWPSESELSADMHI